MIDGTSAQEIELSTALPTPQKHMINKNLTILTENIKLLRQTIGYGLATMLPVCNKSISAMEKTPGDSNHNDQLV